MIAHINTYACVLKITDYIEDSKDIASITAADRGEMLRMLDDRGIRLEDAGRNTVCFRMDKVGFAVKLQGEHAIVRLMEEADFEDIMLNEQMAD